MSLMVRTSGGGSYPYEIYVATPPNKTEYTAGDTLSLSGMTVKAKFNNGKEKDITDEVTTVPADGSVLNDYEVTVIDITWENKGLEYKASTPITIDPPWELISWSTGTPKQIQKMLQAHHNGEINIHDYWAIGDERPVELTTGETVQMVLMHEGQYPLVGDMVDTPAGQLPVGAVIQLNENGSPVDCIVVHQGKPSDMYDESCNGTWVLRKDILENKKWDATNNDYQNSDIHAYLNAEFLNRFDENTKTAIKQVKIPYVNGTGSGGSVASGPNGLSCKIFLLSGFEVGFTKSDNSHLPVDGARLAYFTDASKRIAYLNGAAGYWWLRSSFTGDTDLVFLVSSGGGWDGWNCNYSNGVRPAFVLNPTYTVKAQPTCTYVVGMKDCLNETHVMNSSNTNAGGWNGCEMRTWLNNTVYNSIPESFRSVLKAMNVWTANGGSQAGTVGIYSEDYLALPAEKEVFGSNDYADSSIESQLFQFDWYKTSSNRIKKVKGSNSWWGERSPDRGITSSFCGVSSRGKANSGSADTSDGVSFFGCI